jgi:hypothetical protein
MTKISVLLCEPQAKPQLADVSPEPEAMAELVTGTFHLLDLGEGLCLVSDVDGNKKIKDLNRVIDGVPIFGLCVFCRHDGAGNLLSLTPEEQENLVRLMK